MTDRLEALERRANNTERFYDCKRQAEEEIARRGTQHTVDAAKEAIADHRPIRMGTINTLIFLRHIELLEAELAKEPVRMV